MAKNKGIEEKYQKLTDIEHVLLRPFMYIGSISAHTGDQYLYDGEKVWAEEVTYNPGFIKLFDEIISNSVDEHRRSPKLNEIRVTLNLDTNQISVWDNGGIPVKKHPIHKEWIPEMIFSNLKAGSNFDDSEQRTTAGTNGVGASLTNIFSKSFLLSTCDGENRFDQEFTNNMHDRTKAKVTPSKKGFTEIVYVPDLERFKMRVIDEKSFQIIFKRCLDVAACNNKLTVKFTLIRDSKKISWSLKFKTFEEYIKLYTQEFFYEESKDWKIAFAKAENGFSNISFVNSVHTKDGGSHVEYILNQLISELRELIKKKHRVEVKPSDIRNYISIFIDCTIINSSFSSQTKEKLITEPKDFGTKHEIGEKLVKAVFKSEIIASVLDWVEKKALAQERAELRKLNSALDKTKIPKLIDAQRKGDRGPCILGIYEGLCLEENTEVLIFDGDFKPIKIKDVSIGDLVLSHENKIEQIYQVSKRIDQCVKINLKNGTSISCTKDHRFFVFNKDSQAFDFVEASKLKISIHQFLKNRLIYLDKFHEILDIEESANSFNLIIDEHISIIISKDTKLCIFDSLDNNFKMIFPNELNINSQFFVSFRNI